MKKLLIFMLVFGMASLAAAEMTLQISVNGDKNPVDSEIVIAPSDLLVLDIWTTADITLGVGEGYWFLTCRIGDGTIFGGISLWPGDAWIGPSDPIIQDMAPGEDGVRGYIFLTAGQPIIPAGSVIYDEINFHCESAGDTIIHLYGTEDFVTATLLDSVVVHQGIIPEPTTVLLLGLGGLTLLRKRKT